MAKMVMENDSHSIAINLEKEKFTKVINIMISFIKNTYFHENESVHSKVYLK